MIIRSRIIAAVLLVSIGIFLEIWIGDIRSVWISCVLAALISLSFILSLPEILCVTLFALFALNWQPAISLELIILGALPIVSFLIRKWLPLEPWIGSILLSFTGIMVLYLALDLDFIIRNPSLFAADILLSLAYSTIVFKAMISFFPTDNLDF